jgi:hypothetical protein
MQAMLPLSGLQMISSVADGYSVGRDHADLTKQEARF